LKKEVEDMDTCLDPFGEHFLLKWSSQELFSIDFIS
jgi:hypothetical protein